MEIPLFDHSNAFVILFSYFLVKHEVEYLCLIAVYPKLPLRAIYALQQNVVLNITYAWDKKPQSELWHLSFPPHLSQQGLHCLAPFHFLTKTLNTDCGSCCAQQTYLTIS